MSAPLHLPRRLRTALTGFVTAAALGVPLAVAAAPAQAAPAADWLHVEGNRIVDEAGTEVWLTGANWFGFNATERVFHGLWSVNLESITRSMADHGINIVRVPISTQLLLEWKNGQAAVSSGVNTYVNPELVGKTSLQVFDRFLELAEKYGLKVMLDVHSAEADNAGHFYPVWWKGTITTESFYSAWEWVTDRYKTNDTVVAMDIKNEPHGTPNSSPRAKWDSSTDQDNFKNTCQVAGRRILAINPRVLILCEGIEVYPKEGVSWSSTNEKEYYGTWWGGNLRGVKDHPVDLGAHQDQLVYSPHDYGPLVFDQAWFQKPFTRATLEQDVWDPNWLYIHKQGIAPLLIGEWGGRVGQDERQDRWMTALRDTMVERKISHTFWSLNPNSGDTGGLLLDDWTTWDAAKYAILKPALWQDGGKFVSLDHQVRLGGAGSTTGKSLGELGGTVTDVTPPSVPTGLTAGTATTTTLPLTWSPATDAGSGVDGYDVYRGTTLVGTSSTSAYTVTGLQPGTAYTFTVRARDKAGNVSARSAAVTATTRSGTNPTDDPTSTPTSTPTAPPVGACSVTYQAGTWSTGMSVNVKVKNTGTTSVSGWSLSFTLPAGQRLEQGWSATWSQTGQVVTATGAQWNSALAPGASVDLGFNGTHTGTTTSPTAFTLNGSACTVG
ncbi:cellulase family glycosylhydrolase [Cellulomonas sp. DKR-3]|uniref:cellulase n=1 Tax=Cellulomonas fulva TaxID=2835530 RepID=A0ABS5U130_9CELL|nr:cellulase family glycosylhydrolase [Cellulomonas fulva]MBT0995113.1 cellulase family glycosylhydrolase [Cellulomonas fulva]